MIKPKRIQVEAADGEVLEVIISRFPAMTGREIIAQYPTSMVPKIGDYKVNEAMLLKIMAHVAIVKGEREITLENRTLIDNHVPDWEALAKIEMAIMEYNCSFFGNGKVSGFLEGITEKAQTLIIKILTDLQAPSSQTAKPPSEN
jgi:hypothetical protein